VSAKLDGRVVRQRAKDGKTLSYLEGWYVLSQANRVFGFDAREHLELFNAFTLRHKMFCSQPVSKGVHGRASSAPAVFGPVLFSAFRRLAAIFACDVITNP